MLRALAIAAALAVLILAGYWLLARESGDPPPVAEFDPGAFIREPPRLDAPFIATDYAVVDAMLGLADVSPGDRVVDLGSGDGRILIAAARSHGARGLGVDIDPARIEEATANARTARVSDRVAFRLQDLFETELADADVVTLYLTSEVNLRLRPRLLSQLRAGARVVSNSHDMGDWRPDDRRRIGTTNIYLWNIPARIAGRWRLTRGQRQLTLNIIQEFQAFRGAPGSLRIEQGRIAGDRIRFLINPGDGRRVFEGRIDGGRMIAADGQSWSATRV